MKKILREKTICIIYCFLILISMQPTKENMYNISNLNTIIPGIQNIYTKNNENDMRENTEKKYSLKSIEIFKKFIKQ